MFRFTVSSLFAASVAAVAFLVPAQGSIGRLTGEVGPGFKIDVERAGKDVKTLKAGTYRIHIEDKGAIHNFHLIGPGVNKKTGVAFKGEMTWTVKLKPGRYTYQCDPHHLSGMLGHVRVTA
jgi:Copper binding proteins, plastocyanin/azurin family